MANLPQYGPTILPQGANDGGDGSTKDKATWVTGSDKNARSFIVKQGNSHVRCNMGNALMLWETGYRVVFDPPTGRQVKFEWKGPGRAQFQAFSHHYWEIQQEEEASIARGDGLPGEDLGEEAEEEFEVAGDPVFDRVEQLPMTPSSASCGNLDSSSSSGRGLGSPSSHRGRGSGNQPGYGHSSSGRGRDSGGSGRGQGSPKSPMPPSSGKGKGKGPAGSPSGGSPRAGAA